MHTMQYGNRRRHKRQVGWLPDNSTLSCPQSTHRLTKEKFKVNQAAHPAERLAEEARKKAEEAKAAGTTALFKYLGHFLWQYGYPPTEECRRTMAL